MRVLILCNDFYPFNSIGAERPYSWFKYLYESGCEVTVVTKNWKSSITDPAQLLDNIADDYKEEVLPEGKIIRVPQYSILPERLIQKHGLNKFNLLRKFSTYLYKLLSFGLLKFDQHSNIYRAAFAEIDRTHYDAIITTAEPHILFRYGYLLKRKFPDLKWIADYRDGWYLNHVTSVSKNPLIKLMRKREYLAEKKYLRESDLITSVDPSLAERLGDLHNKPNATIYNGFWEFYEGQAESKKLTFVHSGTLTPAQRIEPFLSTLSQLIEERLIEKDEVEVIFVGLAFYPDRWSRVERFSKNLKNVVRTTDRLPKEEALAYNLRADYLLIFTEATSQAIYAKTYDYIACRRSILVTPDDNGILGDLVRENALGMVISEQEAIKQFLIEAVSKKREGKLDTHLEKNDKLSFFTRKIQASELAGILDSFSH